MAPHGSHDGTNDRPWWLVALVLIALVLAGVIVANDIYAQVFGVILKGLWVTIFVTLVGFALATVAGLGIALMALCEHAALRQIARFYTEVIRGVPILVLLFYIAFVGAPGFVALANLVLGPLCREKQNERFGRSRPIGDIADHRQAFAGLGTPG